MARTITDRTGLPLPVATGALETPLAETSALEAATEEEADADDDGRDALEDEEPAPGFHAPCSVHVADAVGEAAVDTQLSATTSLQTRSFGSKEK